MKTATEARAVEVLEIPEADLKATEKINLRISQRLLLAARQSATPSEAATVQEICQEMLEQVLRARADEAHERAVAALNWTLHEDDEPLSDVPKIVSKDLKPLSVYISVYAVGIAKNLGQRKGAPLSIQKICEPLLSAELKRHRSKAIETARKIIAELEALDDEQDGEP